MQDIVARIPLALFVAIVAILLSIGLAAPSSTAYAEGGEPPTQTPSGATTSPYLTVETLTLPNGTSLIDTIIDGPPIPPVGFEAQRAPVEVFPAAARTLTVPAFSWVFGCSSVSAAMIAGYYDNNGYPNMYTGPTNGGVVPVTEDPSWSTWMDGNGDWYPNNPLIASHDGLDGRVGLGSIDDYWVTYDSAADDPYITGSWTQHAWDSAIGDYMKTSQSAYNNTDGGTHFYNYTGADAATKLTCADMPSLDAGGGFKVSDLDGTYGRKLFYEAKGYTVTDCFNQNTDNNAAGGFSFANYKAQIDANRPVLLNLAGHSVVGVGYNDTSNTVYIHDTWDASNHTMTWGGSYSGMNLMSVSIVSLSGGAPTAPTPKTPAGKISDTTPTYTWTKVAGATQYRYKLLKGTATIYTKSVAASACGATTCTNTPTKILAYAAYKWAVQANVGGVWTSYSPYKAFTITNVPTPKAPTGAITDTTPKFTWTRISGATQYQFSVYKSGALKYTKTVANAACGSNAANCSNTPTTVLAAGGYTWKVKRVCKRSMEGVQRRKELHCLRAQYEAESRVMEEHDGR